MSEASDYVLQMSVDDELLEPLGRVMWAAIRLHHGVRDAINQINGQPSNLPFDQPLGAAIAELEQLTRARVAEPDRASLLAWIEHLGRPASRQRNGVAHAISFTADDGKQALSGSSSDRPSRYLSAELLEVAGQLAVASRELPPGPYQLRP